MISQNHIPLLVEHGSTLLVTRLGGSRQVAVRPPNLDMLEGVKMGCTTAAQDVDGIHGGFHSHGGTQHRW